MNERQEKIEKLKQFFLRKLVEDPQDGTDFDCDVLTSLEKLERKYE
jgi:hypothetical protein